MIRGRGAAAVDDLPALPRIPTPDPATAPHRAVMSATTAPTGLRGQDFRSVGAYRCRYGRDVSAPAFRTAEARGGRSREWLPRSRLLARALQGGALRPAEGGSFVRSMARRGVCAARRGLALLNGSCGALGRGSRVR